MFNINELTSFMNDKDKLIIVANICIKNINKEKGIQLLYSMRSHLENKFDDTVKVIVMPVLLEEKQGIEILNPKFADNDLLKQLNENYNKIIKILEDKIT